MRKFLYGLLGVVVLLVAAALIVPGLVDWNAWKGEIAAQAKAATGRELAIDGDLDFAVLPSPRLTANGVRLKNIPGAGAPDMAVLKSLDVRIRFAPLLSGRIEVASVTLVEPVIRLEKLADGRVNWDFRPPGAKPGAKPAPSAPAGPSGGSAVRLDSVRIANGTLVWRDAAAGTEERVERLNAEIAARSLSGPFRLTGGLVADGIPLDLDVSVGELKEGAALPLSLRAGVRGADAQLELSGAVNDLGAAPRFSGRIEAKGSSMARLVAAAAPGAGPLPGFLGQPFFLQAQLTGSEAGGSAEALEMSLGDARATGNLTLTAGDRPKAALKLGAASIDLDKWLAMAPAAAPARAGSSGESPPAAEATAAPFALPGGMNATVDLHLAAATWRGGALRDIRLQAALTEGELTLSQAALRLPGEAEASLFGFLTAKDGRPSFDGTMEARADNLRGTLDWLKLDTAGIPADRLRKFALSAKLRGSDEQLQVIDAIVSLDTSRIDGGVTFALRERPAFGASVTINQLNLDAYLPAVAAAPPAADPRTAIDVPTPLRQGAKPEASPRGPFAALNDFDANLRVRIGSLTWRQTGVQGVGFDGTLAHGRLEVREAAVQSLAGTGASLKGELSGFDGLPVFRGEFAADSRNLTGLLRMAGLENTLSARRLGTMRLRGKADGGAEKLTFDTALELAGGRAALKGTMEALSATPSLNGTLTANHPELSEALAAFGGGNAERKLGPLAASADINGGLEAMTAQGRVRAVGGELTFGGRLLNALAAPTFDAKVNAGNPEFGDLLRALAPQYRPAAARLGAFRLEASLKGDAEKVELPAIKASVGPASVSGSGTLALAGKRPALTAGLTGGTIDLNPFLPAEDRRRAERRGRSLLVPVSTAALAQAAAPPAQRFSAEPLDLSAMEAMDATVTLGAGALIWRNFRVDNPNAKAVLSDRVLTVEQLAGRLFDGDFLMKGKLDGSKVPALDATVTVKQANVGKALFQAAEFDVAGGKMDFQTALAATGRSPFALVSALNGQGSLKVRDGVVKGFDLKAVSDRLKELDKGLDFLRLLGSSMGGGETKFSALDGTFRVEKGVLRTDDLKLVAEAGEGAAKGTASLPRWTMDFTTQFKLTEHPKAPPFGMQVQGPIDNPRRIFRFEALQTYLLQRGVGTLLRKALPQQPEQGGGEQPQEKRPPTGEELLRGIFENLRRK
jgi:uncharacterized protein involved in outer membrane biogenesis